MFVTLGQLKSKMCATVFPAKQEEINFVLFLNCTVCTVCASLHCCLY